MGRHNKLYLHHVYSCLHSDVDEFYSFVDTIAAPGGVGGDTAEDVFGGLEAATKLSWRKIGTKVRNTVDYPNPDHPRIRMKD